ncbi:MAG: radical SAM protein [Clostridiales bacterium]|jgi:TatD family-associated radical SAM protein|nr:radical SAM protein [Clostridiales bacterium]HOB63952.1 TatD family nuclease-associated radical SAM protein [Clostridia bacterium]HOK81727.1 TatD family nuclease-associated radical SAM protein [Clostridia bacterium]HOL60624.1 TatD family nuclease-associated radical SAM protein [Clostridia bacterium]HPO53031.1 TatD family nuclease-associated radical SAM protein [Clostridia bacterium]
MITYRINDRIYINLTNRCSNACEFCVRIDDKYSDFNLWLEKEPTAEEIIAELGEMEGASEIVFCGYGEPLYRLDAIIPVSEYAHNKGKKTRINTNGQARHIAGEGVAQKLAGYIDTVSISLNAGDAKSYQAICHSQFGEQAFYDIIDFGRECKKYIPRVVFSIVDVVGEEQIEKARKIAEEVGAELRVRRYI